MGIKLREILIPIPIKASDLAGNVIAIDAPNIISSLFSFSHKNSSMDSKYFLDGTQRPISHLYGLLYRVNFYYSKRILPIFCFDGIDSEFKKIRTKDRLKDFLFTERWFKQALNDGDKTRARSIAMSSEYLWPNVIKESKTLLGGLGVPYIESPASAESQCAQLVKDGIARYSNSQDYDSILFGCPRIVRDLSKSLRRKEHGKWTYTKIQPQLIELKAFLQSLNISQFQLVDMGLLIGTDYFPGIKEIGPKNALRLIILNKTIERVINSEKDKYDFSKLNASIIKQVRKIFLFPEVLNKLPDFHWNMPNEENVIALLCRDHRLDEERVRNNLEKVITNFNKTIKYSCSHLNEPRKIQKKLLEY
jgi:flap endonuclease-1